MVIINEAYELVQVLRIHHVINAVIIIMLKQEVIVTDAVGAAELSFSNDADAEEAD